MTILVTGCAGFIGFHVTKALLKQGEEVIGIDNLNDYYDVKLKQSRLSELRKIAKKGKFDFRKIDIADYKSLQSYIKKSKNKITGIIHLAAQAGVRYSMEKPFTYVESNVVGHLSLLELCRNLPKLKHFVYASSSSVYGANKELPYSVEQKTDKPISLYAATKQATELLSYSYSHLYGIPMTGLRFFTVYGPWGRPDMAYFKFTKSIEAGKPIDVFAGGKLKRDFTYIDDVVKGILAALKKIPSVKKDIPAHAVYNLGNDKTQTVNQMIEVLEKAIGRKAKINSLPMQPGDMRETHADIRNSRKILGFNPSTSIDKGLPEFVRWYKKYYRV